MDKHQRQSKIVDIIRAKRIGNQGDLVDELTKKGFDVTQASVSRDLAELGAVKAEGAYRLPEVKPGSSPLVDRLKIDRAGDNLIVVRTGPGHAQMAALHIDKARIGGIVGTIAGDDTIFIAVKSKADHGAVTKKLVTLFQSS